MNELILNNEPIKFDTFICYRGASVGKASKEISEAIYNTINEDSFFGNVFHSEKIKFSYNYMTQAEPIIQNVKHFIIVLCNDFFKDFFKEKDGRLIENPDSATCLELRLAFKFKKCIIHPIMTSEFLWSNIDQKIIKALNDAFGESNIKKLRNVANVLQWSYTGTSNEELIDYLKRPPFQESTQLDCEILKKQLYLIHNLIIEKNITLPIHSLEMDLGAYQALRESHKELFHIPSGYINGVKALQKEVGFSFIGRGFNDIQKICDLPKINAYYYWPIDCNSVLNSQIDISICGICFGILLLRNWKKEDSLICDSPLFGISILEIDKWIQGALSLLITLRDYEQFSWMSTWEFKDKGIAGTINQTTLCLSTLMRCGFLSPEGVKGNFLEKRFVYIKESIHFLLEADLAKFNNSNRMYWGEIENGREIISYSQTCFCFDVLQKYLIYINHGKKHFKKNFLQNMLKEQELIQNSLSKIIKQFQFWCDIGCNKDLIQQGTSISVTDLSRILNSLCNYVHEVENNDTAEEVNSLQSKQDTLSKAKEMLKKLTSYLLSIDIEYFSNLNDNEKFEKFAYIRKKNWRTKDYDKKYKYEVYENCSELLYMISLMSAVKYTDEKTKMLIKDRVSILLTIFNKTYVKETGNRIIIRGKRKNGDLEYPLYALYYYRIVLSNYLDLWG